MRLHSPFFCGGADKALSNCFSCYLQNGLSLSLCLSFSMPHRDIYWSLELMIFRLSSLPACLLCLHIVIPFALLMFHFLSSVWTLSSHSLYIYTQITFVSFSFYRTSAICHYHRIIAFTLRLYLSIFEAKMGQDAVIQHCPKTVKKLLFRNNNWNDWRGCCPLRIMLYFF